MSIQTDKTLIEQSLAGDKLALEQLIKNHQAWIYNVSINLTGETEDAADLTQETLIKIITNLSKFKFNSTFRTWTYRILKNTFLNSKRKRNYHQTIPWDEFGDGLDNIEDKTYEAENQRMVIEEAKLSCMKGMLLCLTPEQRLVYILGELFEVPDSEGSEIMDISKANYRKRLSRTRAQLYGFMNNKCGLLNKNNPYRCAKKTHGFIKKGYVNPENLQFQKSVLSKVNEVVKDKLESHENNIFEAYQKLYQSHNFQEPIDKLSSLKKLLASKEIKETFEI